MARNRLPLFPSPIVHFSHFTPPSVHFSRPWQSAWRHIEPVFRRLIVACPSDPLPSKSSVGCCRRRCSTRPLPSSIVKGTRRPRFRRSPQRSTSFSNVRIHRSGIKSNVRILAGTLHDSPRSRSVRRQSVCHPSSVGPSVGLSPVGRSVTRRLSVRRFVCHPSVRPSPVVKCRERDSFSTIFPPRGIDTKKVQ